jgi:hypothetical protein
MKQVLPNKIIFPDYTKVSLSLRSRYPSRYPIRPDSFTGSNSYPINETLFKFKVEPETSVVNPKIVCVFSIFYIWEIAQAFISTDTTEAHLLLV